jgi:Contractile injection system tube protein
MSFPQSTPNVMKGAIVGIDPFNPLASIVVFQYNPDTLTRTLQAQSAGAQGGDRSEAMRLKGAPVETFKLDVEIDATDQLERDDALTESLGIYPQLSALEMLIYPKSALVLVNTALLAAGSMEVIPPAAPLTLFIWGPKRILPVRLTEFSITEEAYDVQLNPIRAKVSLGLRVLSYNDLPLTDPGFALFLAHQVVKEAMATIGSVGNLAGSVSGSFSISAG